jgi:predicted RNA binding protein YcfA (HicA-like mRNA interferase family)
MLQLARGGAALRFRELDKLLKANGWKLVRSEGSHHTYKHKDFPELATIAYHPGDLDPYLVKAILKMAKISK